MPYRGSMCCVDDGGISRLILEAIGISLGGSVASITLLQLGIRTTSYEVEVHVEVGGKS